MVPLIDTHQHLLLRDQLGYAWSDGLPALADLAFTPQDYAALCAGHGVAGSLFMEADADDYAKEARLVSALAQEPQNAILGVIAGCRPEEDGFEAWLSECADLAVVGMRRILHEAPDEISQGALFRSNIAQLGRAGLVFDMCFRADQLALACDLARACPDTQLVLDHCGVPDISGQGLDPWRADIAAVAACENVVCKLSGILAYCPPDRANLATIRPYLRHVIECFGPARCLWGSDWPVVNLTASLPDWLVAFRTLISEDSASDQASMCNKTAQTTYSVAI